MQQAIIAPRGGLPPILPKHIQDRQRSERIRNTLHLLTLELIIDQKDWDWATHPQEFLEVASHYSTSPVFALAQECMHCANVYSEKEKQVLLKKVGEAIAQLREQIQRR